MRIGGFYEHINVNENWKNILWFTSYFDAIKDKRHIKANNLCNQIQGGTAGCPPHNIPLLLWLAKPLEVAQHQLKQDQD